MKSITSLSSVMNDFMKYDFKILLIGSKGSGKSSLIGRFIGCTFDPRIKPTVGFDLITMDLINEHIINVEICDTAGYCFANSSEHNQSASSLNDQHQLTNSQSLYNDVDLVITVFDISQPEYSFEDSIVVLNDFLNYEQQQFSKTKVHSKAKIMLVGNKIDLLNDFVDGGEENPDEFIDHSTMAVIADYIDRLDAKLYQTSARTMEGTEKLFKEIAKLICQTYDQRQLQMASIPKLNQYDLDEQSIQTWCMVSTDLTTKNFETKRKIDDSYDPFNGQLNLKPKVTTKSKQKKRIHLFMAKLIRKLFCLL